MVGKSSVYLKCDGELTCNQQGQSSGAQLHNERLQHKFIQQLENKPPLRQR